MKKELEKEIERELMFDTLCEFTNKYKIDSIKRISYFSPSNETVLKTKDNKTFLSKYKGNIAYPYKFSATLGNFLDHYLEDEEEKNDSKIYELLLSMINKSAQECMFYLLEKPVEVDFSLIKSLFSLKKNAEIKILRKGNVLFLFCSIKG